MKPEDIQAIFNMQPEAAIEYLKQKHIDVSWDWQDMLDDAHVSAFTVAKTAGMDVAHDIYQAVRNAAETGQAFRDFQRELTPILQAKGWWGRQEAPNPDTGEIQNVQLGSPYRLKTIYLTNLQSAYMAGRYAEMTAAKDTPLIGSMSPSMTAAPAKATANCMAGYMPPTTPSGIRSIRRWTTAAVAACAPCRARRAKTKCCPAPNSKRLRWTSAQIKVRASSVMHSARASACRTVLSPPPMQASMPTKAKHSCSVPPAPPSKKPNPCRPNWPKPPCAK